MLKKTINEMDFSTLKSMLSKPEIFEKSDDKFWDDDHVSAQMLRLHLDPNTEAASKKHDTIDAEANYIIHATGMNENMSVLDLGCGPGLYVERFAKTGANVLGVDLSKRAIDHAKEHVGSKYSRTDFAQMDYLTLDVKEKFDIVTLIFYDFCALSTEDQNTLLENIFSTLKKGGMFVFDIVTENKPVSVATDITVCQSGFWSDGAYIEILQRNIYEQPYTEGLQYTIFQEEGDIKNIRIYHRLFSISEIRKMLFAHGFKAEHIYENLRGDAYNEGSETYAVFARKKA